MLKLLICLISSMTVGVCLVQLRQQRLELNHQTSQLHNEIESRQAKLWNQQLQIATFTSPNAINATVKGQNIDMVPEFLTQRANWIDPTPPPTKSR